MFWEAGLLCKQDWREIAAGFQALENNIISLRRGLVPGCQCARTARLRQGSQVLAHSPEKPVPDVKDAPTDAHELAEYTALFRPINSAIRDSAALA